jgi:O-antigen ligase
VTVVTIARRLDARPQARVGVRSDSATARLASAGTTLVLLAIVYAAVSQGAYYPGQLRLATLLVLAGLAATLLATGYARSDFSAPTGAALALGAWYLVAGVFAHHVSGAVPALELLAALAATVLVVQRADEAEQRLMLAGLLGVGVALALVGWQGVAWRSAPHALEDGGLWRAASTVTYANATAGFLAVLAILAVSWVVERSRERLLLAAVSYFLIVGLAATASRAGIIAFAAGLVWMGVTTRGRVVKQMWPVVLAALIATSALLPSMVASRQPRPLLALGGLLAGAVLALIPPRAATAVAIAAAVGLALVPGLRASVGNPIGQVRKDRATVSSPDRSNELHAALRLAHDRPIAGAGPGLVDLTWNVATPVPATMHVAYAHDEYLQTLDEVGLPGLLVLVAGLAAVAAAIRKARPRTRTPATAGAVAALVVLAVHSSFDFLWHVPLIPLTAAVIVGTLLSASPAQITDERSLQ